MTGELQIRAALETVSSLVQASEAQPTMDKESFRLVYENTARPLFNYLLRVTERRDIAEDVLQEAYCRLLVAKLPTMDVEQIKSYLFKVATNILRDRWRRRELTSSETLSPTQGPMKLNPADQMAMRQAFEQLKLRERELLWLAYVEGASHKEIADYTGLKAGSIRLLLYRARRRLADLIRGTSPRKGG